MLNSHQKSAGTDYTTTVALLVAAFALSPVLLIVSRPFGHISVSLAFAFSALCTVLAWVNWKKYSNLTVSSIVNQYSRVR